MALIYNRIKRISSHVRGRGKILIFVAVLAVAVLIFLMMSTENLQDLPKVLQEKPGQGNDTIDFENYLVNTKGCKIEKLDLMNEKIESFFSKKPDEITCESKALTASDEKYLWINLTEAELTEFYDITPNQLECYFTVISRFTDEEVKTNKIRTVLNFGERSQIDDEFVQVFCEINNQTIYNDYHSFFSKEIEETALNEKFKVMVLGVDSVSRLNFHRMLKMTSKTVLKNLEGIEMFGYHKVGDNTYPNLMPLLMGQTRKELFDTCLPEKFSSFHDNCSIIWNDFKRKRYGTIYAEDTAAFSLFNYVKKGFEKQPVDYYFRTFLRQMEKNIGVKGTSNFLKCLGSRRPIDVLFDYIKKFIKSTINQPFFSFFWTSTLTHDNTQQLLLIDNDLSELLMFMKNEKYLDKTILLILSDHGIRFGSFRERTMQGLIEERLREKNLLICQKFFINFFQFLSFLVRSFSKIFQRKVSFGCRTFQDKLKAINDTF
jgi:Protein of unknown function (DUF229)